MELALRVSTLMDLILWNSACVGYIAVITVAKRSLSERLRELVDAKPLLGAQAVLPRVRGASVESVSESHYTSAVDKRLVASLRGAIWTLSLIILGFASFVPTATFAAIAGEVWGHPPWTFFMNLYCVYA
ncbi:hypothetical protein HK101_003631, partial [Irineochytrium annulatum]